MISDYDYILAKSEENGALPLSQHLKDVSNVAKKIAKYLKMDVDTAVCGALLHDIGKTSPLFQKTLKKNYVRRPGEFFRHEIASLFFISLVDASKRDAIIEMIVAHHKSAYKDVRGLGILDLDRAEDSFEHHIQAFQDWSMTALGILEELGLRTHHIFVDEAQDNYDYSLQYCTQKIKYNRGFSKWRGLLMAADHYASALSGKADIDNSKMFITPDLSFYNRQHELYPLSLTSTDDIRPHTLVTAPTGAGKTDFLLRRCRGRVFYTLPFQASINAMYERIKNDLKGTEAQVHLLHAASDLYIEDNCIEERILQHHVGASVKVLTPHQLAGIAFGIKGYESLILDLQGQDVILDEIHTYSEETQSIVLKIVEVLTSIRCRVHIGTATMPSLLYERIKELLGGKDKVYEVLLSDDVLKTFNRHIIHKTTSLDDCVEAINTALRDKQKILIVCNQVKRSQELYGQMRERFSDVKIMLLHSRFKRGDRNRLESLLREDFNNSTDACIAISTQVVEVSLDISFDLMITECAPIDAMVQRFGRINRKRTKETIGHYKPIYILAPAEGNNALPYKEDVLRRSYDILPDDGLLEETKVQDMMDYVYPDIEFLNINYSGVKFVNGEWTLSELCHNDKAALLELLNINSVVCITQEDENTYKSGSYREASLCEIPCSYKSLAYRGLERIKERANPFLIPDKAYSQELGLIMEELSNSNYQTFEFL